ncbi:MAG: adenylate/guanylate cyclase domain-containing protein [Desulfobacterales bacterium]|nr:adenylate/guanylate cyclase domain-containing protein [Desulfobacterales bacterium]
MESNRPKRKLAGILSADVKGYSRLMGDDELSTVATIEAYRGMISDLIASFRGRVIDSPGDNILAAFESAVDVVEASVDIQRHLARENTKLASNRRMAFRIGINMGDIIVRRERIYGDAVNITARIEGLSEPGGICISKGVYDQVKNKLDLGYEYIGEHTVKNIAAPVKVFRVLLVADGPVPSHEIPYELPAVPSIAVLPFDNMSADPGQEFISDGIAEEIITALSKVPKIFVIARNSSFVYKNQAVKVQRMGRELGVQYILEGSLRTSGSRLRITAQLVDATSGRHLWADRYDREIEDIFSLQDEIAFKILTALQVKLTDGEQAAFWAQRTNNLDSFLKYLQARSYLWGITKEGHFKAKQLSYEAIEADANYVDPYILIAWVNMFEARMGWTDSREASFRNAQQMVARALTLDENHPEICVLSGIFHLYNAEHDKAVAESQQAIALGPNNADVHALMAHILRFNGRFEEAVTMIRKAIRLQPFYPAWFLAELSMCYYYLDQFSDALATAEKFKDLSISRDETELMHWYYGMLVINHVRLGQREEACLAAEALKKVFPGYSLAWDRSFGLYREQAHLERQHNDLRAAGIS